MKKIAVTGSTGLVASRIVELLGEDFEFIELTHDKVDITSKESVESALKDLKFDVLLHSAAYANVDKAETEDKDLCRRLNVDATQYLFDFSQAKKAQFIYISTDYVFVGQESFYDEDGKPNPLNVYGKTKYEGEKVVQDNGMIVRISFPYRAQFEKKKDFVRTLKWLMEQGKELKMVTDSLNTPTFIDDIAHSLKYLINNFSPEVFHLNGSDSFTPYEEALQIARIFSLDSNLVGKTTFDEFYKGKAARPRNTVMKSKKNTFHTMKGFEEGLISIKESLK